MRQARKMLAVVIELDSRTPNNKLFTYSAEIEAAKLGLYVTESGDLNATIQAPGETLIRAFSNTEGNIWAPTTVDTTDVHLTTLANLASRAEWAHET